MTICVGVIDNAGCLLVADGLGTRSHVKYNDIKKIHRHLGLAYALSGYTCGESLMEEVLEIEMTRNDDHSISISSLSSLLRKSLSERDWPSEGDRGGSPPYWDMSYILTDGYSMASISTDMSSKFVERGMEVIGSGTEMAIAVYTYAVQKGAGHHLAARDAIRITSELSQHCGGDMMEIFTPPDKTILVP